MLMNNLILFQLYLFGLFKTQPISALTVPIIQKASSEIEATKVEIISRINCYRKCHSSPQLERESKVESQADSYAAKLGSSGTFTHSQSGYGENLYTGQLNAKGCVDGWYFECDYNYGNSNTFAYQCGHMTQMVWKASSRVGIGIAPTTSGYGYVFVANFDPAGNNGQYGDNVLKPDDACVASCKDGGNAVASGNGNNDNNGIVTDENTAAGSGASNNGNDGSTNTDSTNGNAGMGGDANTDNGGMNNGGTAGNEGMNNGGTSDNGGMNNGGTMGNGGINNGDTSSNGGTNSGSTTDNGGMNNGGTSGNGGMDNGDTMGNGGMNNGSTTENGGMNNGGTNNWGTNNGGMNNNNGSSGNHGDSDWWSSFGGGGMNNDNGHNHGNHGSTSSGGNHNNDDGHHHYHGSECGYNCG